MNTDMTQRIYSEDSNATEAFGEQLGQQLRGGEVIELISDLGGGKTTLTRGIARGAGSTDIVSSPTFTLSKVYITPNYDIYHFDFYRLTDAGLMEHELNDLLNDRQVVVIIEWGEVVQHVLPEKRLSIQINQTKKSEGREVLCNYPKELEYLL